MNQCKQCGSEYEAKRSDSQYCGPTCRSKASRCNSATASPLSGATGNKEAIHATVNSATGNSTQPLHAQPVDPQAIADDVGVMPAYVVPAMSQHDRNCAARGVNVCNTGPWLPASELPSSTINRVSLPGDDDYQGVCVEHEGHWVLRSSLVPA